MLNNRTYFWYNIRMRQYVVIDLKSFFASVECVERGLDPMTTRLVVADPERTEKTICLAITPAMKELGIRNRCRVFEIPAGIDYIMAVPRMQKYIDYAADIYGIYLKYISKEDIHVYSIDEAFLDVTDYLNMYNTDAKSLGIRIMADIFDTTGITATCGIGSNMYLAKVALDITAKHVKDHIGILDEESYCKSLWDYRPITDFWRVGPGTAKRLEKYGMYTMSDVAHCSEDLLYRIFGVDAELLYDHAWGRESTTIADIKAFRPQTTSISSGQVLACGNDYADCRLIVKEMADLMCLDLVDKGLVTQSVTLQLNYENHFCLSPSVGSVRTRFATSSSKVILPEITKLYDDIVNRNALVKAVHISFNNLSDEAYAQYDLFVSPMELEKERSMQKAVLEIKNRFGKNAILKGMNLEEAGTTMERNMQIGGHRS